MKKVIIILLLCIPIAANAANYYVATNGNDNNPGTIDKPFFTLNKAWTVVAAGDIVYMRGGTYSYTSQQRLLGKNGTAGNLIKIWAYPGEVPTISKGSGWTWTSYRAGVYFSGNYVHFRGIKITHFEQGDSYVWCNMRGEDFNHCIFEDLEFAYSGLGSYMTGKCDDNLFLNCDWHDQYDPITAGESGTPYENGDGCNFENVAAGGRNTFRGCRFWNCTDDGLDVYNNDSYLLVENCWAWNCGYAKDNTTIGGDGNGFKLGPVTMSAPTTVLRKIVNCIAYKNQSWGFQENNANCNMELYNNASYKNSFSGNWGGGFHFNKAGIAYPIKNNISYLDSPDNVDLGTLTNVKNNTWNGSVTVTNTDFVSLDGTELALQRKADGSLPDINFMHLVALSDLIDKGVDAGLPFSGIAPDLGAFEQQSSAVASTPPVFKSGVVENETPSILALNYDLNLNNLVIPAASSFIVSVNSAAITVNSVAISGTKVQLKLASVIKSGDIIAVSYTKPADNPLQTATGGVAASLSSQTIVNHISTPTADAGSPSITMTISPNPVRRFINIMFAYATTFSNQDPSASPQIIRILDVSGKLFIEKLLVTGIANIKFPINLRSGVYTVMVLSGGVNISSQKLLVYR
jgi:uncharacterized repeat protein (TIGR02059 family)